MIESDRNMQQQGAENLMAGVTSAVGSIAGSYMEAEERKAKGRAFKNTFNVIAPSLNMTTDKLAQVVGTESLKNDNDWYQASEAFMPILPSLINLQLGQDKLGVQQDQQQLSARMPDLRNQATNTATVVGQGGPSIMGATRRIGAPTGP
jgi:tRNA A37 threonylcarbamoyladenosine synthetase subunit TsaC/SUA5/YrdC